MQDSVTSVEEIIDGEDSHGTGLSTVSPNASHSFSSQPASNDDTER